MLEVINVESYFQLTSFSPFKIILSETLFEWLPALLYLRMSGKDVFGGIIVIPECILLAPMFLLAIK
ncbi:MAG: hypothetical protein Ct9H300mP28_33490 [Pseudomonadota bacterium]|nr:MAG: hypothetical protein Ct9H300mP28_33490 [Pseudomonadota bacterium]